VNIHEAGVCHGDFVPQNVVIKNGSVTIIDFSHARLDHTCGGQFECVELMEAERQLRLDEV
jgi:tRNA A-37 threonylcarbamoyl transferase component Bud32